MTTTPGNATATPVVQVTGFDHLVLRCRDVETTLDFYARTLGLATERVEAWRQGQVPFPSVRIDATTLIDLVPGGSDPVDTAHGTHSANLHHLCLVVAVDTNLSALAGSGLLTVVDGPAVRWGAQGNATSLYVTDPDGTVVELRVYPR
ncbi:MAG: VOC family protein [Acidimicrobiales bacterium]